LLVKENRNKGAANSLRAERLDREIATMTSASQNVSEGF